MSEKEKLEVAQTKPAVAHEDTVGKAKAMIEAEKQARGKRCEAKINQALTEERCILDVGVLITARGNQFQLNIIAQE